MWPVSVDFLAQQAKSRTLLVKVDVLEGGEPILTIQGRYVDDPITGKRISLVTGGIDVTRSNVRRSGNFTLTNLTGVVTRNDIKQIMRPLYHELRVWMGVRYRDGSEEYCPVGTLVIARANVVWPSVQLTCYDRMWPVQKAKFTRVYTVARGTNVFEAIINMFTKVLPSERTSFNFPDTDDVTGLNVFEEDGDRADAGQMLAASVGQVIYADPMGQFTAMSEPNGSPDEVVMRYASGADATLFRPERDVDATDATNAVVVIGDSPDGTTAAPFGYWQDDNVASLTYTQDIGIFPARVTSPIMNTTAKAQAAAETIGKRDLGIADSVLVPVLPNYAHESGDVIAVDAPEVDVSDILVVDDFNIPFESSNVQRLDCRTQVFA